MWKKRGEQGIGSSVHLQMTSLSKKKKKTIHDYKNTSTSLLLLPRWKVLGHGLINWVWQMDKGSHAADTQENEHIDISATAVVPDVGVLAVQIRPGSIRHESIR